MNWYLVSHPSIEEDAKVEAPTSGKARTTFLDYLERNGKISRGSRQLLRKAMAVKLLDDEGDVDAGLVLYYDYVSNPPSSFERIEGGRLSESVPLEEEVFEAEPLQESSVQEEEQPLSPIAEVSLKSVPGGLG